MAEAPPLPEIPEEKVMSDEKVHLFDVESTSKGTDSLLSTSDDEIPLSVKRNYNIHVYRRRWYVLIMYGLFASTQNYVWNTWGPISVTAGKAFGWQDSTFAWIANWGPIAYILSGLLFPWILQEKGLRFSVGLSMLLVAMGATLRVLNPDPGKAVLLVHVGQFLNGLAGPISMAAITELSATWFPPNERVTATALGSSLSNVGVALSFILGPQFIKTSLQEGNAHASLDLRQDTMVPADKSLLNAEIQELEVQSIHRYLQYSCVWSWLLFTTILLYYPSRPPLPPCVSAITEREEYWEGLRSIWGKKQFLIVAFTYGVSLGVLFCWGTVLNVNLKTVGISEDLCGWIGFYSICSGSAVSLIVGRFADWFSRRMKTFIVVLYFLAGLSFLALVLMLSGVLTFSTAGISYSIILGSTLVNAAVPLMFELSCELAYPIGEGTTNGIMALLNNIGGLLFLGVVAFPEIGTMWMNWTLVASTFVCIPIISLLKETYNRLDIETSVPRKVV